MKTPDKVVTSVRVPVEDREEKVSVIVPITESLDWEAELVPLRVEVVPDDLRPVYHGVLATLCRPANLQVRVTLPEKIFLVQILSAEGESDLLFVG